MQTPVCRHFPSRGSLTRGLIEGTLPRGFVVQGRVILWAIEQLEGLRLFLVTIFKLVCIHISIEDLFPAHIQRFLGILIGNNRNPGS